MKILVKIIVLIILLSSINPSVTSAQEKIKLGLLVPLSGEFSEIGKSIIKAALLATNKIDSSLIEIIPKDTESNPEITYERAKELQKIGVKIVIGPVFNKNLIKLEKLSDMTFLSLTNKIIDNPKNIISAGINAESQLNTIAKFQKDNELKKTIFLIPDKDYKNEINKAIKNSKVKTIKIHIYDSDPTKLTKQIEKITKYPQRKKNVQDEILRLEKSDDPNKEKKIKILEKKDTIGKIHFDSLIIADFDESLKSVATSLLYTDISADRINYIGLNQWFDKSLISEKSLQPFYFPSINKQNYEDFKKEYSTIFYEEPNQISFLSYDLVGLIYFLIYKNDFIINEKIFYKKNKFKGKIGVFEINKNKINHILNFYSAEGEKFKKIF